MANFAGTVDDSQLAQSRNMAAQGDPNQANFQMPDASGLLSAFKNMSQTQGTQTLNQSGFNSAINNANSGISAAQSGQNDATAMMRNAAMGNGPSVASAQMNQGLSQAQNNANSMAAANRGSGGLGMRDAMMAGASAQGQAAGSGAVARAQEQLGNIQNYGNQTNSNASTALGAGSLNVNAQLGNQQNVISQQNANTQGMGAGLTGQLQTAGAIQAGNENFQNAVTSNDQFRANLINGQNQFNAAGVTNALNNVNSIADTAGKLSKAGGSALGGLFGS